LPGPERRVGFVADVLRAASSGRAGESRPHEIAGAIACACLKQIEGRWSYRAERQGIENFRTNS